MRGFSTFVEIVEKLHWFRDPDLAFYFWLLHSRFLLLRVEDGMEWEFSFGVPSLWRECSDYVTPLEGSIARSHSPSYLLTAGCAGEG